MKKRRKLFYSFIGTLIQFQIMEITDIFIVSFNLEIEHAFHFSNSYFITLKYCLEFLMILILSIAY